MILSTRKTYTGKWSEVARLPNPIEKYLRDLTEDYSLNKDGTIKVVTRAFNSLKNKAVEATGTVKFRAAETRGQPEVAYFLPIYLEYNILDIDVITNTHWCRARVEVFSGCCHMKAVCPKK